MRRNLLLLLLGLLAAASGPAESNFTFTVGAYNVENWNLIERHRQPGQPKPQDAKDAVIQVIAEIRPDVLAVVEMGNLEDFAEFRGRLAGRGLDYPHWEHLQAVDRDRHVALISRFPITHRQSRADHTYELDGQSIPLGRGILDVTIGVNSGYAFRAIAVHLKSKRQVEGGPDQAQMRLAEAHLLRAHIGKILKHNPDEKLLAMGDFNDTPDSPAVQAIIGAPPFVLFPLPCKVARGFEGTHLWRGKGEWSRIDYLLASPALSNDFVAGTAKIYEGEAGFKASDHRLIYAQFRAPFVADAPAAEPAPVEKSSAPRYLIVGLVVILLAILLVKTARRQG
jgi:endonuclease/exonuclease/phosphatase family metal-dependent hydrolase